MTSAKDVGRPGREQPVEVERLLELVGPDEVGHRLGGLGPGLGHGHPVAVVLVEDLAPPPVDVVHLGLVPHRLVGHFALDHRAGDDRGRVGDGCGSLLDDLVAERGLLEQPVGHVDPEAVDAAVQPETEDVFEQVADLGVAPVEVGLGGVEEMEVPLAVVHPGPGRAAEDRLPVVGRQLTGLTTPLPEQVAGPLRAPWPGGQGCLEPLVLAGGVVGHQVDDHLDAERVRRRHHGVEVGERAEPGVDVAVVGDVVAVVVLGRGVEGRDPDGVDAQLGEVGQPRRDAAQVAEPVAVGVGEGADVDLVADRVLPPLWIVQIRHVRNPLMRLNRTSRGRPQSRHARRAPRCGRRSRRAWPRSSSCGRRHRAADRRAHAARRSRAGHRPGR